MENLNEEKLVYSTENLKKVTMEYLNSKKIDRKEWENFIKGRISSDSLIKLKVDMEKVWTKVELGTFREDIEL
ncbi:hypothetical protein [Chryseobacterium polytrichastri]|nr:hypothetical protein [Chryseobacterium polytrichastri]